MTVIVRSVVLVSFSLLVAWEFWKAVNVQEPNILEIDANDLFEKDPFDDYQLTNEYLLTTEPKDIECAAVQRARKRSVLRSCHARKKRDLYPADSIHSSTFNHILVSDKHQLLYCAVPKVACTNWKRVLLVLDGFFPKTDDIDSVLAHNFSSGYFRRLSDYTPDEINLRLSTYYKFLFVRHPYSRLASAFRNKFVEAKYKTFKVIYGKYIMRKYRQNNTANARNFNAGEGVTFAEFVRFIVNSPIDNKEFWNEHWERIDRLCMPCLIQYDFVGKFETMMRDADYLLRILDVSDKVSFPRHRQHRNASSTELSKKYLSEVSEELREKLYQLYKHDFLMYNYEKPDFS